MSRRTPLPLLFILAACALPRPVAPPGVDPGPPVTPPVSEPVPRLQLPEGVRPVGAVLELRLDPGASGFSGTVDYQLDLSTERTALWLNGQGLTVTEAFVEVAGARIPARYLEVDPVGVATVTPARSVGPGRIRLHLAWRAPWSVGLQGLFRTDVEGASYLVTQFEPVAARRAFPSFDEPRFKHPWEVTLVVPAGLVAVGNTLPVSDTPTGDGQRRLVLATTRPLPSYLLAWAVGPWDVVEATAPANQVRRTPLPVRGLAPAGRGAELAFALRDGNALLAVLERWFGTPHPYDKLDHLAAPDFSGAMENAGLIIYASQALLLREADASHRARTSTWSYMAHEMAHLWFGDLVTMPWWNDTWLNESFASWMEDEAVALWRAESRARLNRISATDEVMELDSLAAARAVRQPLDRIEEVHDQFDDMSYAKGSAIISMIERWIGPERFRAGIRAYLADHADASGDAEQLFAALSAAAGREVGPAFHSFLDQPGVPQVTTRTRCEGGRAWLELSQRRWLPIGSRAEAAARWRIPLCASWGLGAEVREGCTMLDEPTGSLPLGPGCPDWVAPNAGGAGYYRTAQLPSELTALLTRGWPLLTVEERLVTAQSAVASVRTGALPVAEALPLLARLARDPDGVVAATPIAAARRLVERVAPPDAQAAARRWASALYAPALDRLGLAPRDGEPAADTALRVDAAYFMAEVGLDRPLRDRLARSGLAWLDPGGPSLRREAVPTDLAGLAVGLAVEEGGTPVFELAERRLATERDGTTRLRLLRALSRAREPSLVARAQALTEAPDTALGELLLVPRLQIDNPALEQAGWDGYRRQADRAAARVPDAAGFQPSAAATFCDAARLAEAKAFFGPRAQANGAMARPLAESLESIELCLAAVAAQREQAVAAFQGWAAGSHRR